MSEDDGGDRRRCEETGKVMYAGPASARKAVRAMQVKRRAGRLRLHEYHCPSCHHWHVGHDHQGNG